MSGGFFITFEGPEGAGKSTQIRFLADYLTNAGFGVVRTREPGGTPVAEELRQIVKHAEAEPITPATELLLMEASRAQHVANLIRPALAAGKSVLCDRFSDSTLAYQGYARGGDVELIARLNDLATGGIRIDRTILLDLPVELTIERARRRAGSAAKFDRFERENAGFHRKVREGFLKVAESAPERVRIIDGSLAPEIVSQRIIEVLDGLV